MMKKLFQKLLDRVKVRIYNVKAVEKHERMKIDAVVRAADQCAVKKHFEHPPVIRVDSVVRASALA
jgi:hypothetical protein